MKQFGHHFLFWIIFCRSVLKASLEEQRVITKKTDGIDLGWWDTDPTWPLKPQPPAPIGPLSLRTGPVRPPAPLLEQVRPPAPLVQPPAPMPNNLHPNEKVPRAGVLAENINCLRSNGVTLLSAVLTPPVEYASQPVFEDAIGGPEYSPTDCSMTPHDGGFRPRTFAMYVHHFNKCGVRVQKGSDGKEWISVTLRFPFVEGLRMAEDEYVMIMCKPQDRVVTSHHVMDIKGIATEGRSIKTRKVFRSGPKDMACRMSLMARGSGGQTYELKSGGTVRVGQDLQVRAVVKEGDGWNFVTLKDVVISRTSSTLTNDRSSLLKENHGVNSNTVRFGRDAVYRDQRTRVKDDYRSRDLAQLVFADGCRNPQFKAVAPLHPRRDPHNPLIVSFVFKAFMFRDMLDGETLKLSAQVVACTDITDCLQSYCNGDAPSTKTSRKRRAFNETVSAAASIVQNFTEDLEMSVTLGGFSKTPFASEVSSTAISTPTDCKLVLITVFCSAILICVLTTASAAIALGSRRKALTTPRGDYTRHMCANSSNRNFK